jgi:hypothetical protein
MLSVDVLEDPVLVRQRGEGSAFVVHLVSTLWVHGHVSSSFAWTKCKIYVEPQKRAIMFGRFSLVKVLFCPSSELHIHTRHSPSCLQLVGHSCCCQARGCASEEYNQRMVHIEQMVKARSQACMPKATTYIYGARK